MRINRLAILLIVAICSIFELSAADKYKLVKISTSTIKIGGKTLKVGDTFSDQSNIEWSADPQRFVAKNLTNGRIISISRKQMESGNKAGSLKEFYLRNAKASTRGLKTGDYNFITSNNSSKYPERRIALVIGNSNYSTLTSLKNPLNDASDLTDQLLDVGFDVFLLYDGSYQVMRNALIEFGDRASSYNAAIVYYSGHGVQNDKRSYLVPVEAALEFRSELEKCIDCSDVLDVLDATQCDTRIAFFDSCRNIQTNWTRSISQEVSAIEGSPGTVIFFSTRSGRVAQDGDGSNSPFAKSLIDNIKEPIAFSELSTRLVRDTYSSTNKVQYPITSGTLLSDFKFNPLATAPSTNQRAQTAIAQQVQQPQVQAQPAVQQASQPAINTSLGITCSNVNVKATAFHRNGTTVTFNLYVTNQTGKNLTLKLLDREPCNDQRSMAYDDQGNTYTNPKLLAYYGENMGLNVEKNYPANVPVKMTIHIFDVPRSVTYFPLITLQFRGLPSGKAYGMAEIQIKDLPEDTYAKNSNNGSTQAKQSAQNAPSIDVNDAFKVTATNLVRSGNNVSFYITFTNQTEKTLQCNILGTEPCDGTKTQAYDNLGNTYEDTNIRPFHGENTAYSKNINFPPNVPVKLKFWIYDVPRSVSYFPLINMQFRGFPSGRAYGIDNVQLHNWSFSNN